MTRNLIGVVRGRGGVIALALLVCGLVFAAFAGPAESLHARSQALRQTIAGFADTTRTVQATIQYTILRQDLLNSQSAGPDVTESVLGAARQQIAASLTALPVPLSAGAWTGLVTKSQVITSGYPAAIVAILPPQMVFAYRDTLAANSRLVAGSLTPGSGVPAGALAVSTTTATAARFGLHPGSRLVVDGDLIVVTGIVSPVDPDGAFWQYDLNAQQPSLNDALTKDQYWVAEVLVDPGQLDTMTTLFGNMTQVTWVYPVGLAGLNADQAQGLYNRLNHAATTNLALPGELQNVSYGMTISSPLAGPLLTFLQIQAAVVAVLLVLFASLGAIGIAVVFLAARMIADQRNDELIMLRARGASARQVAVLLVRSAALAAVPAAAVGAALALAIMSSTGGSAKLSWTLTALTLVVAIAAPAIVAVWRHRRPTPAANPALILTADIRTSRISLRGLRRITVELTLTGAAIAGLAILHGQGTSGSGTNWFLTLAPVLVAIPAVLITLRLYPLLVRAALRVARRRAGATSYVALAASARTSLATAGPVFALVLALNLAAFAGMVTTSISSAQNAQSWQITGGDALITGSGANPNIVHATQQAVAAVRGVQHAAAVWTTTWTTPSGQGITVYAVNPAKYAALTAATPFPAIPAGTLSGADGRFGVLASPAAAAALGRGTTQLTALYNVGPIQVHVTGIMTGTPAVPSGTGAWILIPLQNLPGISGAPAPGTMLVTGTGIDRAQLSAALATTHRAFTITYRSDVLASLTGSPLQHGAVTLMLLTAVAAAAIALLNLILGLALGAADRDLTLSRLTVMGVRHGPRLALTENVPAILAAIIASTACALALPALTSGAMNLSVFTSSERTGYTSLAVTLRPDLVSVGLPAAILLILTAATLVIQTRASRHRGASSLLRVALRSTAPDVAAPRAAIHGWIEALTGRTARGRHQVTSAFHQMQNFSSGETRTGNGAALAVRTRAPTPQESARHPAAGAVCWTAGF
jgi:putative ABC transport system permease protein